MRVDADVALEAQGAPAGHAGLHGGVAVEEHGLELGFEGVEPGVGELHHQLQLLFGLGFLLPTVVELSGDGAGDLAHVALFVGVAEGDGARLSLDLNSWKRLVLNNIRIAFVCGRKDVGQLLLLYYGCQAQGGYQSISFMQSSHIHRQSGVHHVCKWMKAIVIVPRGMLQLSEEKPQRFVT